ncbi:hypothetical protein VMT65_05150 [Nocardia sp. CDC153]|uniref:hypothetical protein n=1 Tax=Nocardia sp. CDC153 TaxID=3112167 RepID=UPI002DBC55E3|nr:hypothetical protein [Nocardia sp. CDC153]MEC3952416.1 hypothetical protein [Nocardia sp. CDC153]
MTAQTENERIGAVVDEAYRALAFDPGGAPEWDRFHAAFVPEALLALRVFPQDTAIRVLTLDRYAAAQLENELGAQGYGETPGRREVTLVGDVAAVRQEFTMNFADRDVPAVDLFLLARVGAVWRIVAVASDMTHN